MQEKQFFIACYDPVIAKVRITPIDALKYIKLVQYYNKRSIKRVYYFEGHRLVGYVTLKGHRAQILGNIDTYDIYCVRGSDDDFLRFETFLKKVLKVLEKEL